MNQTLSLMLSPVLGFVFEMSWPGNLLGTRVHPPTHPPPEFMQISNQLIVWQQSRENVTIKTTRMGKTAALGHKNHPNHQNKTKCDLKTIGMGKLWPQIIRTIRMGGVELRRSEPSEWGEKVTSDYENHQNGREMWPQTIRTIRAIRIGRKCDLRPSEPWDVLWKAGWIERSVYARKAWGWL